MSVLTTNKTDAVEAVKDLLDNFDDTLSVSGTLNNPTGETKNIGGTVEVSGTVENSGTFQNEDADGWRNGKPDRIGFLWEYNQNDRRNYPKPSLYIWSPISATHEKFSINGESRLKDTETEVIISTQDPIKTREYAEDTVDIFDKFYADNEDRTTFYELAPTEVADLRNENIPRQSQNYYATVTLEGRALKDT